MSTHDDNLIIVIGRGHSGTRILAHTLLASRVYIGQYLNVAGDKVPAKEMYEACRIISRHVTWTGGLSWDFDQLHSMPIDPEFAERVEIYLKDVLSLDTPRKGWKLPETTLVYPWIVRMFPQARYVYILRDPRDALLGLHLTDDLDRFDVSYPETDDELAQRVASWKYQYDIVEATPEPGNFISVRYEDLVLDQDATLRKLEDFLGIPLARILIDKTRIGLWKSDRRILNHVEALESPMRSCGYS
jgi:hypothetical protein